MRFALGACRNIWSLIVKLAKGRTDKTELVDYRTFSLHSVKLFCYSVIRAELLTHVKLQANIIKGIISYHKRFKFPLKFWVNLAVCFFQNIFNTNHWRNINPCLFLRIGEKKLLLEMGKIGSGPCFRVSGFPAALWISCSVLWIWEGFGCSQRFHKRSGKVYMDSI